MGREFTATLGLVSVIWGCTRTRASMTPFAVAAYFSAAYWFTSSTSFANPAVTARVEPASNARPAFGPERNCPAPASRF